MIVTIMCNLIIITVSISIAYALYYIMCIIIIFFIFNLISPLLYTVSRLYARRRRHSRLLAFYIVRITVRALRAHD